MTTPRQDAAAAGSRLYRASPCKACGGTTRYTSCGNCVACALRLALMRGAAKRAKRLDQPSPA
jgi:hypothetical protein